MYASKKTTNLQIAGEVFGHWTEVEITLEFDSFSTATFRAPFDHRRPEFRRAFQPFSFPTVSIDEKLVTLFKGTMVSVDPKFDPNGSTIEASCYSLPGVLQDSVLPRYDYRIESADEKKLRTQLEFKNVGLMHIASQCCHPFGLNARLADKLSEGPPFKKVKCEPEKKVFDFLVDLAKQRGLIIGNTPEGDVLFYQATQTGSPRARFVEGRQPLKTVEPQFNPREYFSEITGHAPKKRYGQTATWSEFNPFLSSSIVRCHYFKCEDSVGAGAMTATTSKMGRMFANAVSWTLPDLPGWRDPSGELWRPNTTVTLLAPSAMVYRETELLIRTVKLKSAPNGTSATLELTLPSFGGALPDVLPWAAT